MMQIYNWWGGENSAGYIGASSEDDEAITWYDELLGAPLPPIESWTLPVLTQYRGANGKRKPRSLTDCVSSAAVNLISERAAGAMADIWRRHAALYPVRLDDSEEPYYMVVATTELDCIDREHSTGPLQKYGGTPNLYASVYTWQFDLACLGDADLFVLPDSRTNIFVSERFKNRIEKENLSGFTLRTHFWETDPWES